MSINRKSGKSNAPRSFNWKYNLRIWMEGILGKCQLRWNGSFSFISFYWKLHFLTSEII